MRAAHPAASAGAVRIVRAFAEWEQRRRNEVAYGRAVKRAVAEAEPAARGQRKRALAAARATVRNSYGRVEA